MTLGCLSKGLTEKCGRMKRDGDELKSESPYKYATKLHTQVFRDYNFGNVDYFYWYSQNWTYLEFVLNFVFQNIRARKMA